MRILILLFLLTFQLSIAQNVTQASQQIEKAIPVIEPIDSPEFAEVLLTGKLISEKRNEVFASRIYSVCNGPADPELEYCNCSFNYYIVNGTFDILPEQYLFKIGPFPSVDSTMVLPVRYVSGGDDSKIDNYTFVIQSGEKGEKVSYSYRVYLSEINHNE